MSWQLFFIIIVFTITKDAYMMRMLYVLSPHSALFSFTNIFKLLVHWYILYSLRLFYLYHSSLCSLEWAGLIPPNSFISPPLITYIVRFLQPIRNPLSSESNLSCIPFLLMFIIFCSHQIVLIEESHQPHSFCLFWRAYLQRPKCIASSSRSSH